jgi:hypothetical protein
MKTTKRNKRRSLRCWVHELSAEKEMLMRTLESARWEACLLFLISGMFVICRPATAQECQWSALGRGVGGSDANVRALAVHDDGSGPGLYAAGLFTMAGGDRASNVARWDGAQWSAVGSPSTTWALTVYDDGSGPALYKGGSAGDISRWDGTRWLNIGTANGSIYVLQVYDDGSGPALYAGGNFVAVSGVTSRGIVKWDAKQWSSVGGGVGGSVWGLTAYDDGSGPALYAGGGFTIAGDVSANRVAKWDGKRWLALGSGVESDAPSEVHSVTTYDDGSGPVLYVGGTFTIAGGAPANSIAKWDGNEWSPLGRGITGPPLSRDVRALAVYDDGSGPGLYAGGTFSGAGDISVDNIAKWDGTAWSPLSSGVDNNVAVLEVYDDGGGNALYAGGRFNRAGDAGASRIAAWRCSGPPQ